MKLIKEDVSIAELNALNKQLNAMPVFTVLKK